MGNTYKKVNNEKDMNNNLTNPICDSLDIQMDIFSFFSCIKENSQNQIVKFDNCLFHLSNIENKKIGMDLGYGLKFTDCSFFDTFDLVYIGFKSMTGDSGLLFIHCSFECNITLDNVFISVNSFQPIKILFDDCTIKQSCTLTEIRISNEKINCESSIVIHKSMITLLQINNSSTIKLKLQENDIKTIKIEAIRKLDIDSKSNFNLTLINLTNISRLINPFKIKDNCNYSFDNVNFESTLSMSENGISKKPCSQIKAETCTFEDEVNLNNSSWNKLHFQDIIFKNKLWIADSDISELYFLNCKFEKSVKIFNLKNLIKKADFSLSTIKGLFLFNGWNGKCLNFEKKAEINFSNIYLSNSGYMIIRAINSKNKYNGDFSFESANILGVVVFADVNIRSLNLEYASVVGSFNAENPNILDYKNRKTLVILKNEAFKKGDNISAIEYKSLEMMQYKKELKGIEHFNERILLFLNTLSNNNGINWIKGVFFTCITAWIFFFFINFCGLEKNTGSRFFEWGWTSLDSFENVCANYLNMFYLTEFKDKFSGFKLNALGDILFLISKIFVSYGIYQTISAFRKYGK